MNILVEVDTEDGSALHIQTNIVRQYATHLLKRARPCQVKVHGVDGDTIPIAREVDVTCNIGKLLVQKLLVAFILNPYFLGQTLLRNIRQIGKLTDYSTKSQKRIFRPRRLQLLPVFRLLWSPSYEKARKFV